MRYQLFQVLHVFSLFLLVGVTFAAFAAPHPEYRRRSLMWSGICSLLVFVSGFGLLGILGTGFPGWVIVKLLCWLLLSVLVSMAFRRPHRVKSWLVVSVIVILMAVGMVSFKPF
jgi:hypothetical protein